MNRGNLMVRLAPWLYTVIMFLLWELVVRLFKVPAFFLPPPSAIALAIVEYWDRSTGTRCIRCPPR
jgi:NitT/TauT family transport system permease protein